MFKPLPDHLEPLRLAEGGVDLRGCLPISEFSRLAETLRSTAGEVEVTMTFGRDIADQAYLHLRVNGTVQLACQRCLEPLAWPVAIDQWLGLVRREADVARLPERYEPLLVPEEPLVVRTVVEDEVLLALPVVAMHPPEACSVGVEQASSEAQHLAPAKQNPFAVLAALRGKH